MFEPHTLARSQLRESPQMQIVDPDRIRLHRTAHRWSLRRVAQMCGRKPDGKPMCSHTAIRDWENGDTVTCPEEVAIRLSEILGFPVFSVFRPTASDVVLSALSSSSGMAESA
jgi:transcriptional regulator with XRE-family HTH domain